MKEITVTLPSGEQLKVPYGTRVQEIIDGSAIDSAGGPFIAASVNNEVSSLSFKIEVNASVVPIGLKGANGARIYRRSLCFALAMAAVRSFPGRRLVIGHSLGDGYYFYFDDHEQLTDTEITKLHNEMDAIVANCCPITRVVVSYVDAAAYLKQAGQEEQLRLLGYRNSQKVAMYDCDGFRDISHGPMVPNTEFLKQYDLKPYESGFLLRYPSSDDPNHMKPFKDLPVIFSVFQEYKAWGKILGVHSVGRLNDLTASGDIKEFIRVAEALHDKKISEIADRVHGQRKNVKVVLIAGPSSSGKTTFTKKLSIQLRVLGFNPVMISLDDYFVPSAQTPKDENGDPDYESLNALDIDLLNEQLMAMFAGKEVEIPIFDFLTGTRKPKGRPLVLGDRNILLMEGIHGLNPALTPIVPHERKFRVYTSALTQLNLDDANRIPTTDNRLVRRMVRDFQFRGHDAVATLGMWPSVRRGEQKNIFPFQENADAAFNSALDYELAVLKMQAEPLLTAVKPYHPVYGEARRLSEFLANFVPIPVKYVPDDSILREFIGDSAFRY